MDELAEMHLLLREHGWEPEIERDNGPEYWVWTPPEIGRDRAIFTGPGDHGWPGQLWSEYDRVAGERKAERSRRAFRRRNADMRKLYLRKLPAKKYFSVAGLRKRLKELSKPDPAGVPVSRHPYLS